MKSILLLLSLCLVQICFKMVNNQEHSENFLRIVVIFYYLPKRDHQVFLNLEFSCNNSNYHRGWPGCEETGYYCLDLISQQQDYGTL